MFLKRFLYIFNPDCGFNADTRQFFVLLKVSSEPSVRARIYLKRLCAFFRSAMLLWCFRLKLTCLTCLKVTSHIYNSHRYTAHVIRDYTFSWLILAILENHLATKRKDNNLLECASSIYSDLRNSLLLIMDPLYSRWVNLCITAGRKMEWSYRSCLACKNSFEVFPLHDIRW